jgi:hypothetical protein
VIEVLRKVCTSNELKEIMNLQVETAVYWAKENREDTLKKWIEVVLKDRESLEWSVNYRASLEKRTKAWFGIPLRDYLGTLLTQRTKIKTEMKKEMDPERKAHLFAQQENLKLQINTLYGVLASPYFKTGNTVVANNITARGRVGAWMLAKSLLLNQSITDGGHYSLEQVTYLKTHLKYKKKPGLHHLSDVHELKKHRSIEVKPLGGVSWEHHFNGKDINHEAFKNLDELAYQHVKDFWSHYDLDFPYKNEKPIEHKINNLTHTAIYWGKANYAFDTPKGKHYAFRGHRRNIENPNNENPMFDLMDQVLEGNKNPKVNQVILEDTIRYKTWKRVK